MDEHRSVMRVSLPEPVVGFAGDERVYVIDASLRGVRISHLAPYKRPSQIFFVDTMPVTPTGKIVKEELAKLAASWP